MYVHVPSARNQRTYMWLACALAPLAMAACGAEPQLVRRDSELVSSNGVSLNGVSLNGVSLNGVSLNGVSLNGVSLNGVSLNGVSLNGVSLNGVSLNGSKLQGTSGSSTLIGSALVGAKLVGSLSNGSPLSLRIDAYRQGASPDTDVHFYKVAYAADGTWKPLCGTDANAAAVEAIPLKGRWDYTQGTSTGGRWIEDDTAITFACVNTALGKCVNFGYKPWTSKNSTSLRPYHQACTRMLRADYCGNGTPNTVNGTELNLYDKLGVQLDTTSWQIEAEWREDGASCVKDVTALRLQLLGIATPACVTSRVSSTCGAFGSSDGSLLITEYVHTISASGVPTTDPIDPALPVQ